MLQNDFIKVHKLSDLLIKAVILIPFLVLVGWQFNIEALKCILPGLSAMNPTTAVLFILCGISVDFIQERNQSKSIKIGKFIGLFIAIIALIRLSGFNARLDLGLDQILYANKLNGNRMNLYTVINFILVGTSIFLISDRRRSSLIPTQIITFLAFLISLLALIRNLYATDLYYQGRDFTPMAIHTAVTFILLTCSIFLSRYRNGFIRFITQRNTGARLIRTLLPIAIGVPIVVGLLALEGQKLELYDGAFGSALGIIIIITIFTLLMLWLAKSLDKADIKRKEAELSLLSMRDELSANELKYRNLIENAGVVMYTTSIDGCITFSSSKAYQLTGYTLQELAGMHFTHLLDPEWKEEIKGKYKNQVKNNIEETFVEFCIRTKNGEKKWVEQSAILVTENNLPVGFQCIVKDISERKEMEAVLRKYEMELVQNQKRLQSVLDNATSFIYIKDMDGKYLVTNEQFKETFNVSEERVIGKTAFNFADPDMAQRWTDADQEVIRKCKHVEIEEIIEMPDGKHHFLIIKFPLLDAQNNIYGLSGIGTDITERVRYEQELIDARRIAEDAKKLQEQFLANMSHEIRTPMNGIQGMTDLLLETSLNDEQNDFVNTIKRSSDNLLVIINDILDFSKIQAGKLTIEKIDFKLIDVVDNLKSIFRYRIQEKGITFDFKIDSDVPATLNGDPYRLNQVLVNLLGNAIKFTHSGGINVSISTLDKTSNEIILEFTIADTGIGIETDKINEIFESFTQASVDTSRKYGGTGLGLAITKQLLELQNGTISVKSKIDNGTTFKFSIPFNYCAQTNDPLFLSGKDVTNYSSLLKGKSFLVAEDNEVNQKVIRHVLQKAGGSVDIANNGLEAIAFLEKNSGYHLIIMDLQMPEMDGYEATKYIRNKMRLSTPIVAMTASALKGEKTKCIEIGMNDYLSKPFEISFLYKRISQLLGETPINKTTMETTTQASTQKLFDLSMLEDMDDNEYLSEILTLYCNNTPTELKELEHACAAGKFEAVYQIAHKIKGSSGLLQASELLDVLANIEESAKAGKDGLTCLAEQARDEYSKIEGPLKDHLKNINSRLVAV